MLASIPVTASRLRAARPVGAHSTTRLPDRSAVSASAAITRVLPVPAPPTHSDTPARHAFATASACDGVTSTDTRPPSTSHGAAVRDRRARFDGDARLDRVRPDAPHEAAGADDPLLAARDVQHRGVDDTAQQPARVRQQVTNGQARAASALVRTQRRVNGRFGPTDRQRARRRPDARREPVGLREVSAAHHQRVRISGDRAHSTVAVEIKQPRHEPRQPDGGEELMQVATRAHLRPRRQRRLQL